MVPLRKYYHHNDFPPSQKTFCFSLRAPHIWPCIKCEGRSVGDMTKHPKCSTLSTSTLSYDANICTPLKFPYPNKYIAMPLKPQYSSLERSSSYGAPWAFNMKDVKLIDLNFLANSCTPPSRFGNKSSNPPILWCLMPRQRDPRNMTWLLLCRIGRSSGHAEALLRLHYKSIKYFQGPYCFSIF